jgi:hypothetical protein
MASSRSSPEGVRLAELVAALSLGIDLGFGQPMEHVLRQCLIALRIANQLGLDERARSDVYYTSLLISVGCHADAHEQAKWFGDDLQIKSIKFTHGLGLRGAATAFRQFGAGKSTLQRLRLGVELVMSGHRELEGQIEGHARLASLLAVELGLAPSVADALAAAYEMWGGGGWPGERSGDAIPLASRIAQIAEYVEVAHRSGGTTAAVAVARKFSRKQFDPSLVRLMCDRASALLDGLDAAQTWDAVIDAEPALALVLALTPGRPHPRGPPQDHRADADPHRRPRHVHLRRAGGGSVPDAPQGRARDPPRSRASPPGLRDRCDCGVLPPPGLSH